MSKWKLVERKTGSVFGIGDLGQMNTLHDQFHDNGQATEDNPFDIVRFEPTAEDLKDDTRQVPHGEFDENIYGPFDDTDYPCDASPDNGSPF